MSIQPYNKAQQGSLPGSDKRYLDQELLKIQTAIGSIEQAVGPWTPYTPTITPGSGAFTAVSATGRYQQIGKLVSVQISITITTNGSAAAAVYATLPVAPNPSYLYILSGRENNVTGKMTQGIVESPNLAGIIYYDGSYPGGNGYNLIISGVYEAA